MFGDIITIADNTLLIEGLEPSLILKEPDVASALLYRSGETLYIMDTGATLFFRGKIIEAAERLRPFRNLILLNSHGHPDHTPNNAVIDQIPAETKKHFISEAGIPLLDYYHHFEGIFATISEYYHIENGPGFPWSLMIKPLNLLRYARPEIIDGPILQAIVRRVMSKLTPLEPSISTAVPFEREAPEKLPISNVPLSGWNINGDVYVVESRGHTPDSVCFYLPKVKVLFLSDETTDYFNIFPISCATRVIAILKAAKAMAAVGMVDVLIGGHQQEPFRGPQIIAFLDTLLEHHEVFRREVLSILERHPEGATVCQIYGELRKRRHVPAVDRYFRFEFPKMPPFLKTEIFCLLVEAGYRAEGPAGEKRFIS